MVCFSPLSFLAIHKLQCSLLGAWGGSCLKKLRDVIMCSGLCGEPDVSEIHFSLFLECCGTLRVYMIRSLGGNSNNPYVYKLTTQTIPVFIG